MSGELFDVLAVNINNGVRRILDSRKTEDNAEAIIKFAIVRRGCETEYYIKHPHDPSLRFRLALKAIRDLAVAEPDDLIAANMRRIAIEALRED